jgi:hypothetical protein
MQRAMMMMTRKATNMMSNTQRERLRRMTPGERLALAFQLTRANTSALVAGSPEIVARRFELLRRENDARNRGIVAGLLRCKNGHE